MQLENVKEYPKATEELKIKAGVPVEKEMIHIPTPGCGTLDDLRKDAWNFLENNPKVEAVIGTFNLTVMVLNRDNIYNLYSVFQETENKRLEEVERRRKEEAKQIAAFVETYELLYGGVQFKDEDAKKLFLEKYFNGRMEDPAYAYAKRMMCLMQYEMEKGEELTRRIIRSIARKADTEDVSEPDAYKAEKIVATLWKYGDIFKEWSREYSYLNIYYSRFYGGMEI